LPAPLSNYEVENLLQKHVGDSLKVAKTRARDQFSGSCSPGCGIINMDTHTGPGTHFTLYMLVPGAPHVYYFDSFGVVPPPEVEKWLKTSGKPIAYSSSQVQPVESSKCGYYCVYVAAETLKKSFLDALLSFNKNPEQNELLMEEYFRAENIQ
jgi:hypothetical protein